jgi:hypothetical protein
MNAVRFALVVVLASVVAAIMARLVLGLNELNTAVLP